MIQNMIALLDFSSFLTFYGEIQGLCGCPVCATFKHVLKNLKETLSNGVFTRNPLSWVVSVEKFWYSISRAQIDPGDVANGTIGPNAMEPNDGSSLSFKQ